MHQALACQALPAGEVKANGHGPHKLIASKCHGKTIARRVAEHLALHSSLVFGGRA